MFRFWHPPKTGQNQIRKVSCQTRLKRSFTRNKRCFQLLSNWYTCNYRPTISLSTTHILFCINNDVIKKAIKIRINYRGSIFVMRQKKRGKLLAGIFFDGGGNTSVSSLPLCLYSLQIVIHCFTVNPRVSICLETWKQPSWPWSWSWPPSSSPGIYTVNFSLINLNHCSLFKLRMVTGIPAQGNLVSRETYNESDIFVNSNPDDDGW